MKLASLAKANFDLAILLSPNPKDVVVTLEIFFEKKPLYNQIQTNERERVVLKTCSEEWIGKTV